MAVEQKAAQAGKRLGRYRIERELGRGGMGIVYLARDEHLEKRVALKTTTISSLASGTQKRSQRRERFIREVRALAQVNHENVVHVFDAGEQDDADLGWLLFYSMEFVDGLTLAELVHRQGALDPAAAAAVCMQTARGLGAAHAQGIVHRDVKPANIFIAQDGRALIGDFGICKIEGSTQITRRDQLVGTPNYLAPEQILGEAVTPATDVFALAALYYIITTLRPLRQKVDANSLLKSSKTEAAKERMLQEKRIPEGLRKVFARALERDPKKRYKDGHAFAEAISKHASRVPSLTAEKTRPRQSLQHMTPDTDPFAPMAEARVPAQVEEAAAALLNDFQNTHKKEKPASSLSLPTANVESTAMFNLRKYEEEMGIAKALPVAKVESTAIFESHMLEGAPQEKQAKVVDFSNVEKTMVFERPSPQKRDERAPPQKAIYKERPPMTLTRALSIAGATLFAAIFGLVAAYTLFVIATPGEREIPAPALSEE